MLEKLQRSEQNITSLKEAHPQLFKSMFLKVLVLLAISITIFVRPEFIVTTPLRDGEQLIPFVFWGYVYLTIALMFAYGISNGAKRYKWARRALFAGSAATGMWAVGYMFALFTGQTDHVFGTIFWNYICLNFIIWSGEPAFNPLSSALHEKTGTISEETTDVR